MDSAEFEGVERSIDLGVDSGNDTVMDVSMSDSTTNVPNVLESKSVPRLDIANLINSMKAETKIKKSSFDVKGALVYTLSPSQTVLSVLSYRTSKSIEIVVIRVCLLLLSAFNMCMFCFNQINLFSLFSLHL